VKDRIGSSKDGFIDVTSLKMMLRDLSVERFVKVYDKKASKKKGKGKGEEEDENDDEEEKISNEDANYYVMKDEEIAQFDVHGTRHVKSVHVLKWLKLTKLTDWSERPKEVDIVNDIVFPKIDNGESGSEKEAAAEKKKLPLGVTIPRAILNKRLGTSEL